MIKFLGFVFCLLGFTGISLAAGDATTQLMEAGPTSSGLTTQRTSGVFLGGDLGSDRYRALQLAGQIGLGSIVRANFGLEMSGTGSTERTTGFRGGADAQISRALNVRTSLQGANEPGNIRSRGISVGAEWSVSSLWQSELDTSLSLDFSFNRIRQGFTSLPLSRRISSASVSQQQWSIGLSQELTNEWSFNTFLSSYRYRGNKGNELNDAVGGRRQITDGLRGVLSGYPLISYGFGIAVFASEFLRPAFSYSHSKMLSTLVRSDTFDLSLAYQFRETLIFSFHGSRTKQELAEPSWLFGPGISLQF